MAVLEVKGLRKTFSKGLIPNRFEVLKGVDFSVPEGSISGFLGANGAGKTTTMKCLLELNYPDRGEVRYFNGQPMSVEVKSRIGFLPERPYFYEYLTGIEFLMFYGQISMSASSKQIKQRAEELLARVDMTFARDKSLRDYSKGMLQKIGLAQALIHRPEFVILDEPMSGLDPDGRMAMREIIQETAKEGTSILLSSHLLHDAESLCDRLVILKGGQVVHQGPTHKLLESVNLGYSISYTRNGERVQEDFHQIDQAQDRVKSVYQQGGSLLEFKPKRMSLEQAFVRIALRGGSLDEDSVDHR